MRPYSPESKSNWASTSLNRLIDLGDFDGARHYVVEVTELMGTPGKTEATAFQLSVVHQMPIRPQSFTE
jgi:hypothetical protein